MTSTLAVCYVRASSSGLTPEARCCQPGGSCWAACWPMQPVQPQTQLRPSAQVVPQQQETVDSSGLAAVAQMMHQALPAPVDVLEIRETASAVAGRTRTSSATGMAVLMDDRSSAGHLALEAVAVCRLKLRTMRPRSASLYAMLLRPSWT